MQNKYVIVIPNELNNIKNSNSFYCSTEKLICNAKSFNEAYIKYPNAIAIQQTE